MASLLTEQYLSLARIYSYFLSGMVGWCGVNLKCQGVLLIWLIAGQGPTALESVRVGVVWTFLLSSIFSLLFLPLFGRRPDID